jgi:hypothetical protein
MRPDAFTNRPVDGRVPTHSFHKFPANDFQPHDELSCGKPYLRS